MLFFCVFLQPSVFSQPTRDGAKEQLILRIQQLMTERNLAGARQLLGEAAKQYPADAGFDNLLGIIEAQEGNAAAAESSFNRAIKNAPKFTGAYLNLGRLYQENSPIDPQAAQKALAVYRQVLEYDPDHAEANYQSAMLLMRQGAYQDSLDRLRRLPASVQQSAQALSVACADYAGLGESERANETASRLLAHHDFSELDVRTIQTTLAAPPGVHDALIIKLFEGLQKRQQLSPEMMRSLALAHERAGQLDKARDALEKSRNGERPSVPLLVELARVAHQQRDDRGSLGYLAHARDLEPRNASLHYYFGLVCVRLNLIAEARDAFAKALGIEPDNASFNYAMGTVSAFRHEPAEAIPYFEKYLRLKPEDERGKLALGAALFRAKDYAAASKVLTEAVKYPGNATTAHFYLGSIARHQGRLEKAVHELELALKAKPDYPDALAELGQCYLVHKDYERAGAHLRRALEINPDHYAANFNLLTLYARAKDERRAAQEKRFAEVQKLREEKMQEFLRIVEVRPFPAP